MKPSISTLCIASLVSVLSLTPSVTFGIPKFVSNTLDSTERMFTQHVLHPFYLGVGVGYGNTDWSEITTSPDSFASESAPIGATQSGAAYAGYMGYQFSEHFTLEGIYTKYPTTTVSFAPGNIYFLNSLKTDTDTYSLLAKILVPFGFTKVYIYADAGATMVHRKDTKLNPTAGFDPNVSKVNKYKMGASFGFGLAYNITSRLFAEAAFQYTTGYGKADIMPAEDYIPFVYSATFNLAVRFGKNPEKDNNPNEIPEKNSIYVVLNSGYGNSHLTHSMINRAKSADVHYSQNAGFTVGGTIGYQFIPYLATQLEYFYLPQIAIRRGSDSAVETQNGNLITPELKVIYPITDEWSLFAKGGYGIIYIASPASLNNHSATKDTKTAFEPIVGGGVEYRLMKRIGINLQYTGVIDADGKYPNTNIGTFGVSYYF